jgi:hypothetical protein
VFEGLHQIIQLERRIFVLANQRRRCVAGRFELLLAAWQNVSRSDRRLSAGVVTLRLGPADKNKESKQPNGGEYHTQMVAKSQVRPLRLLRPPPFLRRSRCSVQGFHEGLQSR